MADLQTFSFHHLQPELNDDRVTQNPTSSSAVLPTIVPNRAWRSFKKFLNESGRLSFSSNFRNVLLLQVLVPAPNKCFGYRLQVLVQRCQFLISAPGASTRKAAGWMPAETYAKCLGTCACTDGLFCASKQNKKMLLHHSDKLKTPHSEKHSFLVKKHYTQLASTLL